MANDSSRRKKKKNKSPETDLSSHLNKLTMTENECYRPPFMATNEYYYILQSNEDFVHLPNSSLKNSSEHLATSSSKNQAVKSERQSLKQKKKKEEQRMAEITSKLKSIQITVHNDQSKKDNKSLPSAKKMSENEKKDLLVHLKNLQSGKISSDRIVRTIVNKKTASSDETPTAEENLEALVNSMSLDKRSNKKVREQIKHAELAALNRKIQDKIDQIKPRLAIIANGNSKNGLIDKKKIVPRNEQPPQIVIPNVRDSNKKLNIPMTAVGDKIIYRYSIDQLYQLQQLSTWSVVPTLVKLKLCKTPLSDLDKFVLTLVGSSVQERNELILNKAQQRKFIARKGEEDFTFLSPNFVSGLLRENSTSSSSQIAENDDESKETLKKQNEPDSHVEFFKKIAKSDEELNFLLYQHEFMTLFSNALKGQMLENKTAADVVDFLVESKQAYIVEGEIRINQKNNQEAYVTQLKGMKDVCINKIVLRKHSFHGDFVRVLVRAAQGNGEQSSPSKMTNDNSEAPIEDEIDEIVPGNGERTFGCVLDILERRHPRRVLGTFASLNDVQNKRKHIKVNVRDSRVPTVRVSTSKGIPANVELTENSVVSVEITGWIHDQPQGKIVGVIGKKGLLKTENIAILQQNNLDPQPFDQNILDELPKEPFVIPQKEFDYREDLRKKCIFSIDPETARDLDDALSCEVLNNGNWEVGVHISDVSYFVKENTQLDDIVKEKATTIYLVDTVYHMLPEKLCLLCSLLPGADKMAYSVFFEMDPKTAEIYNTRYTRSIINSCGKLSYDHAQMVIEQRDGNWSYIEDKFPELSNGYTVADVAEVIMKLQTLALMLRQKREEAGALKIDQPKLSFKFDRDDQRMEAPIDFFKYCAKDSNRLIEEFMLLANISVATFISKKYPEVSLLRHHDPPSESAMKKLLKVLEKHGIRLEIGSSGELSKSIKTLIANAPNSSGMNAAINLMVSKTMSRAKYFCSAFAESQKDYWHYALSIPIYTHFTSPIRRYADIMVHRVLNAALGYESLSSRSSEEIQKLAIICNTQKYNAKLAGDDSSNLYFMHFIQSLKTKIMKASILGIFEYNLEVVLVDTGHVIKVYYKNLQQSDDVVVKTFCDSPPHAIFHLPKQQSTMKVEFGMEISVQVEVLKDKLIINKIFYNQQ